MATVATTTPMIMTTAMLTTTPVTTAIPATTVTPATWYRAAAILPIAPSATIPTTRHPGRISATMVCGILAHKSKRRAAQTEPLFFYFYARNFPCSTLGPEWVESLSTHSSDGFSFGRLSWLAA